jgi:hypothetical protein
VNRGFTFASSVVFGMKHLLSCDTCGHQATVDASDAGRIIKCECGAHLEVPSLRGIRELPALETPTLPKAKSAWSPKFGAFCAAGLVLAMIGLLTLGYGLYIRMQITIPERRAPVADRIDQSIEELDAEELWDVWTNMRDEGLGPYYLPDHFIIAELAEYWRTVAVGGAIALAVGAILAIAALIAGRRRSEAGGG